MAYKIIIIFTAAVDEFKVNLLLFISIMPALFLFILLILGCLAHGVFSVLSSGTVQPGYSYFSYEFPPISWVFCQLAYYFLHKLSPKSPKSNPVPKPHPYIFIFSTESWLLLFWPLMPSDQSSRTVPQVHHIYSSMLILLSKNHQNSCSMYSKFSINLLFIIYYGSLCLSIFILIVLFLICLSIGPCFQCEF